ncbi:class I SAM-dependent methyltransferase [Streptomyces sp. NBC_01775]|uniref:class I SAM-dependent methyltransferase n=1 Tax=Streptomyces sp. NBC_01775 TaxID=2975939 RepID=UPI002DDA6C4E|nr:class I SAM-dependent methyltransferase [Streptomyces sp. NBC_01775]WSB80329.1 class I SAM-dependent methyltransferase [Streptomyces sp. NBC_01775]
MDNNKESWAQQIRECRACGSTDWQNVVSLGQVPLANGFLEQGLSYEDEPRFPLAVVSCRDCRLLSLTHVVDPAVLFREYLYVTSPSDTMRRHMRRVADLCEERFGIPAGSLVVEMGSNTGEQLAAFQDDRMRVLGVDPARALAAVATERGVPTLPDFFSATSGERIREEHGPARLVLGRHVFAHIDDIADVAAGVRRLLRSDGVFAIEVPYALDMLERNEFDTIYHEHLSYFMVDTLATFFARHGLRVVDVEHLGVHGGSILVFVGHQDGPWPTRPVVDQMREKEQRAGLHEDAMYTGFAQTVEETRHTLTRLVGELRAEGRTIAGYGAPAKGNTLLTTCGLSNDQVEFCTDTTELKQGKVLPGTHVPVRSPAYGEEHPPDYYLLLAWNYSEEILRKERDYLESGGRFIVPIPRPRVVTARSAN